MICIKRLLDNNSSLQTFTKTITFETGSVRNRGKFLTEKLF